MGLTPRFTCLLHWWVAYSFRVSAISIDGGDELNSILTLLLLPILISDDSLWTWSKSNVARKRFPFWQQNIIFYALLAIDLQMSILYFQAFFYKLFVPEWLNGTAVYYWFTDPEIALPDYLAHIIIPIIETNLGVKLFTWGAIGLEFLLFLGIFAKHYNIGRYLFYVGILLHLMIGLFHGLWSFFVVMIAGLILYLSAIKNIKRYI